MGLIIEGKRLDLVVFKDQEQRLDFQSLQLQYQLIDQLSQNRNCDGLLQTFDESLQNLESTRVRLENYNRESSFNQEEFDLLKREYIIAEVNYWMLYSNVREICELKASTILYFFSADETCADCPKQSLTLTWLKYKLGPNVLTFVFDGEYADKEPLVALLKESYNVSAYPAIVINNKVFKGFTDRAEILKEICPLYNETIETCDDWKK